MKEFEVLVKFPACLQVLLMEELTLKKQRKAASQGGRHVSTRSVRQAVVGLRSRHG